MSKNTHDMTVIIPTRNAGHFAQIQVDAFKRLNDFPHVIIIDSGSTDGSPDIYRAGGCEVVSIAPGDFNHGATRNYGMTLTDANLLVFMTQDAILQNSDSIDRLCAAFDDPKVGLAYGRQLPRKEAKAIERHARLFNYPAVSSVRSWPEARDLGIRAIFNSNSFSAGRREAFNRIGGFPRSCLMGEDQIAAANALLNGYSIAYVSDALVEHSHGYTLKQEFKRYFDNGHYHEQFKDLFSAFKSANGEGKKYVLSETRYLLANAPLRLPEAALRTALKLFAYHLGRREAILSNDFKQKLTMNPVFFQQSEMV